MRPRILISFLTRFEECTQALRGIAHFERTHQVWTAFHDDQARAELDVRWLRTGSWDGVISRHANPRLAKACGRLGIPLIDLNDGAALLPGVPKIRPDNTAIGHMAAEHFIDRGFKHFGFTGFSNERWSIERRRGFVEALGLAGHACAVFEVEYPGDVMPSWESKQITSLARWIRTLPRPTALMAGFDVRAQQILAAAAEEGILVPEEIAVVGVNNDLIRCELSSPPLSSVQPNAFLAGYRAAATLADMLAGREPASPETLIEPVEVVTRLSSEVLAIEDRSVAAALSYIRQHACNGATVDAVVAHVHVSRSQLEKNFRRHLRRSPQAEIRRVRLARVKQLLLETDYPLKHIAEIAGFDYVEYLCVAFTKAFGQSPGEYRRQHQKSRHALGSLSSSESVYNPPAYGEVTGGAGRT